MFPVMLSRVARLVKQEDAGSCHHPAKFSGVSLYFWLSLSISLSTTSLSASLSFSVFGKSLLLSVAVSIFGSKSVNCASFIDRSDGIGTGGRDGFVAIGSNDTGLAASLT